jgi:hypothetical protein
MPPKAGNLALVQCDGCHHLFKQDRGVSVHQYHCPNSSLALSKLLEQCIVTAPLVPFQIPLSTNKRSDSPMSFVFEDNLDEEEEEADINHVDPPGSVDPPQNVPFELMEEHLNSIPGEANPFCDSFHRTTCPR